MKNFLRCTVFVAVAFGAALASPAQAVVISGASSAYGEFVSLTTTPVIGVSATLTSGPLPQVSGTAPAPYNLSSSLLSVTVGQLLSAGLLDVAASSNVNGGLGSRFASGSASVASVTLDLLSAFGGISAQAIQSGATVNGDFGALSSSGTTTLVGLSVQGVAAVNLSPAPNTVLLDALGLKVTLNEQIVTGDGTSTAGLTVNAIHVEFTDFATLGLGGDLSIVNGDIILSHSMASLTAQANGPGPGPQPVPEPASLALLGLGLASLGLVRRRIA